MLLNPNPFYISKAEKIFFSIAVFMYFLFYGVLAIALYFNLPNSNLSVFMKLVPMTIASVLFFNSLMNREYGDFPPLVFCFFLYIGYCLFLNLAFTPSVTFSEGIVYGRLYYTYLLISQGILPFLLFLLPAKRFFFLANNPWLFFVPSFISLFLLVFLFRELFVDVGSGKMFEVLGINRSTVKPAMACLFLMSLYYVIFSKKIYKLGIGFAGLFFASVMILKSTSQSLLLSSLTILLVAAIFSFRSKNSVVIMSFFGIIGGVVMFPYLYASDGYQRLMRIADLDLIYTYGSSEYDYSRLELILKGWDVFKSSPFLGGNLYLGDGYSYSHFFPIDVLMVAGLLGIPFLLAIALMFIRVYMRSWRALPLAYVWILMFSAYDLTQGFFHGQYYSILGPSFAFMLTLDMLYRRFPEGIPDYSDTYR